MRSIRSASKGAPHQASLRDLAVAWTELVCRTGPDTVPDDALIEEAKGLADGLITTPARRIRDEVVSRLCLAVVEDLQQMNYGTRGAS